MDIKRQRREAGMERQQIDDNYPGGYAPGSAASDQNPFWWARAQSFSEGAGTKYSAIERENDGEHARWGTPYEDVLPHPNGVPDNVGYSGVASRNVDDPLGNPCNFHSNPGYMGTSTANALQAAQPGSIYRTPGAGDEAHRPMRMGGRARQQTPGRSVLPASSARQPTSEGAPLVMSTGGVPGR